MLRLELSVSPQLTLDKPGFNVPAFRFTETLIVPQINVICVSLYSYNINEGLIYCNKLLLSV